MDNNLAEQAIKPFTIGRKNWGFANSIYGARAGAVLYSIVETTKANDLKVYDYLKCLISKPAKHAENTDREFLKDLLLWSQSVQENAEIAKILNSSVKILIYEITGKAAVSFIVWYSCLITYERTEFSANYSHVKIILGASHQALYIC